ncbi:uncharacterized protein LOC116256452 isoform X3 [Nymphaea colorata]|uniref:uncharacterized protein LOC116256452 isoform X3 n=1 Tax=Nymphaea colorata TaxID=210225 RepID=UPI00162CE5A7|nr:uncharacterized protein LOC116256452 isoform X3 [Nymphaea colorata]
MGESMSDVKDLDTNKQEPTDSDVDKKENDSASTEINEEEIIKKKYGGILPKKPPLISKDHEHAFFDSADWALGKQGAQEDHKKGPLEALRPKLQPTPQEVRSRRSVYAPTDGEGGNSSDNPNGNY